MGMVVALTLVGDMLCTLNQFPPNLGSFVVASIPWLSPPIQPYPLSWLRLQQAIRVPEDLLASSHGFRGKPVTHQKL